MPFTLRVYFAGLNMLVPKYKKPVKKQRNEKQECEELIVLLPNITTPQRINQVLGRNALKVHQPAILYLVPNRVYDDPRYPLLHDDEQYLNGLWLIDREDLQMVDDANNPLGDGVDITNKCGDIKQPSNPGDADKRPKCPTENDWHDIHWMSPLRDDKGELHRPRTSLVDREIVDPAQDVAGRFFFRSGRLKNAGFSHTPEHTCMLYSLGNLQQAVSTMVYMEIPIEGDRVYLTKQKFNYETPSENAWSPLVLQPFDFDYPSRENRQALAAQDEETDKIVEICLINVELDELIRFLPSSGDEDEIMKRIALEQAFLVRLLQERDLAPPPRLFQDANHDALIPIPNLVQHPPWRRWLTPDRNGQSPRTSGNCNTNIVGGI